MATLIQLLETTLSALDPQLPNQTQRIHLKERLQALVLDFIYNHAQYRSLNFYGGTCLHVIYGLNRLSEDIDLDNSPALNLETLDAELQQYFHAALGYRAALAHRQESRAGILRITLRFPVLFELGLSAHRDEMLHLKVEISQHPQVAVLERTPVIHQGRSFVPVHFSLETMMAGKMLACLERNFQSGTSPALIKGRDFYDLLWFMQQDIQPLADKLAQDGAQPYSRQSAMLALREKIQQIRPSDLAVDLLPLFEQRSFIEAWLESFHATFERLVRGYL